MAIKRQNQEFFPLNFTKLTLFAEFMSCLAWEFCQEFFNWADADRNGRPGLSDFNEGDACRIQRSQRYVASCSTFRKGYQTVNIWGKIGLRLVYLKGVVLSPKEHSHHQPSIVSLGSWLGSLALPIFEHSGGTFPPASPPCDSMVSFVSAKPLVHSEACCEAGPWRVVALCQTFRLSRQRKGLGQGLGDRWVQGIALKLYCLAGISNNSSNFNRYPETQDISWEATRCGGFNTCDTWRSMNIWLGGTIGVPSLVAFETAATAVICRNFHGCWRIRRAPVSAMKKVCRCPDGWCHWKFFFFWESGMT